MTKNQIAGLALTATIFAIEFNMNAANAQPAMRLTAEQQIGLACAKKFGGTPAAAKCTAAVLTSREFDKCRRYGIGTPNGCFGPNNDARKLVETVYRDLKHGPGPNNDLVGKNGAAANHLKNAQRDLKYGMGPNNEIRKIFGF